MKMTIAHWRSTKVSSFVDKDFFGSQSIKLHIPFFVDIRFKNEQSGS